MDGDMAPGYKILGFPSVKIALRCLDLMLIAKLKKSSCMFIFTLYCTVDTPIKSGIYLKTYRSREVAMTEIISKHLQLYV